MTRRLGKGIIRKAWMTLHIEDERLEWPYDAKAEVKLLHEWGLGPSPQEAVWVIAYDSQKNVRTAVEVARGMHATVDLHLPTMLAAVLVSGAERFMIAHNHPTGDPTPTAMDDIFTKKVRQAADATSLYLEDHLIVTPNVRRFTSYVDQRRYIPATYGQGEVSDPGAVPGPRDKSAQNGPASMGVGPNTGRDLASVPLTTVYDIGPMTLLTTLGIADDGNEVVLDFAKAPHLLMAGMSGSGKSVFMTAMLTELISRFHPRQLVMHLIDPKRVELSRFADAPHLLDPPAYDNGTAIRYLEWAAREMDYRFGEMEKVGVRDMMQMPNPRGHYLIVIDELANLMLQDRKTVEPLIVKLATVGPAAGVHLVLATQRPSADVLTGVVRSNIPTRLSFRVLTEMDSRIILDQVGGEKLTRPGEMLARLPGSRDLMHIRGRYVPEESVQQAIVAAQQRVAR